MIINRMIGTPHIIAMIMYISVLSLLSGSEIGSSAVLGVVVWADVFKVVVEVKVVEGWFVEAVVVTSVVIVVVVETDVVVSGVLVAVVVSVTDTPEVVVKITGGSNVGPHNWLPNSESRSISLV